MKIPPWNSDSNIDSFRGMISSWNIRNEIVRWVYINSEPSDMKCEPGSLVHFLRFRDGGWPIGSAAKNKGLIWNSYFDWRFPCADPDTVCFAKRFGVYSPVILRGKFVNKGYCTGFRSPLTALIGLQTPDFENRSFGFSFVSPKSLRISFVGRVPWSQSPGLAPIRMILPRLCLILSLSSWFFHSPPMGATLLFLIIFLLAVSMLFNRISFLLHRGSTFCQLIRPMHFALQIDSAVQFLSQAKAILFPTSNPNLFCFIILSASERTNVRAIIANFRLIRFWKQAPRKGHTISPKG
jgi:hypothetical protein